MYQFQIIKAIFANDIMKLETVLDITEELDINFSFGEDGLYPLMIACQMQNLNIIKLLLWNSRISTSKKDKHGYNCLHVAA